MSAKAEKVAPIRRAFVTRILEERPRCEFTEYVGKPCPYPSMDVHEKLTRARGGDILDPDNVLAVCRGHHGMIHDNPAWATAHGLLTASWDA